MNYTMETTTTTPLFSLNVATNETADAVAATQRRPSRIRSSTLSSLADAPMRPRLLIDLEQVCGYQPSTMEEYEQLKDQLQSVLYAESSTTTIPIDEPNFNIVSSSNPQQPDDDTNINNDNPIVNSLGSHESPAAATPTFTNARSIVVVAPHFDQRATELLDAGMAYHITNNTIHATNSPQDNTSIDTRWIIMDYPDFLCRRPASTDEEEEGNDSSPSVLLPTARMWNSLSQLTSSLQPSSLSHVPVITRVFSHLQHCHRSLLWKYDMGRCLQDLMQDEYQAKLQEEYTEWCRVKRSQQLSHLYQVRETLHQRHAMLLQPQVQVLQEQRDHQVQVAYDKYLKANDMGLMGTNGSKNKFASLLFVGDAQLCHDMEQEWYRHGQGDDDEEEEVLAVPATVEDEDDDQGKDDADEGDERDDRIITDDDDDIAARAQKLEDTKLDDHDEPSVIKKHHEEAHSLAKPKPKSKGTASNHQNNKEEEKDDDARTKLLDRLMEQFTTPELRRLEAMEQSLLKKLQEVDDLLESLQDEEWAAEEENEHDDDDDEAYDDEDDNGMEDNGWGTRLKQSPPPPVGHHDQHQDEGNGLSLLDQILAMILGRLDPIDHQAISSSTPPSPSIEVRRNPEHLRWIQQEHTEIVAEWKEYFCRLPPSPSPSDTVETTETSMASSPMTTLTASTTLASHSASETKTRNVVVSAELEISAAEKRHLLGIVENDHDDWDEIENWDEIRSVLPNQKGATARGARGKRGPATGQESGEKLPAVGLRPGGRITR
jgi:hypothetical protein